MLQPRMICCHFGGLMEIGDDWRGHAVKGCQKSQNSLPLVLAQDHALSHICKNLWSCSGLTCEELHDRSDVQPPLGRIKSNGT